jgi:hypothetical protein
VAPKGLELFEILAKPMSLRPRRSANGSGRRGRQSFIDEMLAGSHSKAHNLLTDPSNFSSRAQSLCCSNWRDCSGDVEVGQQEGGFLCGRA